jgi:hypothetical protein
MAALRLAMPKMLLLCFMAAACAFSCECPDTYVYAPRPRNAPLPATCVSHGAYSEGEELCRLTHDAAGRAVVKLLPVVLQRLLEARDARVCCVCHGGNAHCRRGAVACWRWGDGQEFTTPSTRGPLFGSVMFCEALSVQDVQDPAGHPTSTRKRRMEPQAPAAAKYELDRGSPHLR